MTTPLEAAEQLAPLGYALIPVPFGSKNPRRTGWQSERLTEADLPRAFSGARLNIGVLCGEPSGGLVDVDLDAQEAIDAAELLLPATGRIGGRGRRPRSHRWYRTDPPPPSTRQFIDPIPLAHGKHADTAMLLELRSTGGHTVVYGQHPEGDAYQWDAAGAPTTVDTAELERACALTAAAAFMGRYWPAPGSRHTIALAWAGFLLSSGLPDAEAERLIEAACAVAGDREAADRIAGVKTTRTCIEAGEPHTGASTLIKAFGGEDGRRALDTLSTWLGLARRTLAQDSAPTTAGSAVTAGDTSKESQATAIVRLAAGLFTYFTSESGEPFAVAKDGPPIARMLRGGRASLALGATSDADSLMMRPIVLTTRMATNAPRPPSVRSHPLLTVRRCDRAAIVGPVDSRTRVGTADGESATDGFGGGDASRVAAAGWRLSGTVTALRSLVAVSVAERGRWAGFFASRLSTAASSSGGM